VKILYNIKTEKKRFDSNDVIAFFECKLWFVSIVFNVSTYLDCFHINSANSERLNGIQSRAHLTYRVLFMIISSGRRTVTHVRVNGSRDNPRALHLSHIMSARTPKPIRYDFYRLCRRPDQLYCYTTIGRVSGRSGRSAGAGAPSYK